MTDPNEKPETPKRLDETAKMPPVAPAPASLPVPVSPVPAHLTTGAIPVYGAPAQGAPVPVTAMPPVSPVPHLPAPSGQGYVAQGSPSAAHGAPPYATQPTPAGPGAPYPAQHAPYVHAAPPPAQAPQPQTQPAHASGAFPAQAAPFVAPPVTDATPSNAPFVPPANPTSTGSFAQKPITGQISAVPAPGATRLTVQMPESGTVLSSTRGQYLVAKVIGSGEFGAVFECTGPFDQSYAVKVIRPANRPYAEVQAEWAREVSRLMSLRHPNVVYIHDAFEAGALFFLALEKCDHALKSMLGSPMQEGLVLELSRQLLAAVQFLHDNDIVHDDLHAGNVLVTHATDRPVVKISDFGISHELRGLPAIRPNVVHHAIMAPEILATGYTSKQSDLYQVGLLLYWMITGESAIPSTLPYAELVRYVADGEPRKRAEALGTPLSALVAKMLRRREAFRYSSAREVWSELRELRTWKERAHFPQR